VHAPILHQAEILQLQFSPAGDYLLTASADRIVRLIGGNKYTALHELPPDPLLGFAQCLSGRMIDENSRLQCTPAAILRATWQKLRPRHSHEFALADREAWHRAEALTCERNAQWFGAQFHWGRLAAISPRDTTARTRRDQAAERLQNIEATDARKPEVIARIPPRPPAADRALIDLSAHYNAALTETWLPGQLIVRGNDLSSLPRGLQKLAGTDFDLRGLVQLSSAALENLGVSYPARVNGIPVHQRSRRLRFLHGAVWSAVFGTHIGQYRIHYANGEPRDVKLIFGRNTRDWWFAPPTPPQLAPSAAVAWEGSNAASRELGMAIRLYQFVWENPRPETEITTIDFISAMERPAPFLVGITVECADD
jgi:hypothetical protein